MSRADAQTTTKAMANAEDAIEAKPHLCSGGGKRGRAQRYHIDAT